MSKYADIFIDNQIDLDVLPYLEEVHLEKLGIPLGNRLRLLKAIEADAIDGHQGNSCHQLSPVDAESAALPAAPSSDAERRPLTVMFCDLADSTALSTELDPEDLQDIIRAYQETCAVLIQEYGGYIARYMGDGILVYYGYPKSLERNAERAVRSAINIVEAMAELNRKFGPDKDIEVAVRLGIATGMVMVGEIIGEGLAQERTVVGEAPNMAARLQGLAERNGIVIGALTKELSGNAFCYKDMGHFELKGIENKTQAWNVRGLREETTLAEGQADNDGNAIIPDLVGRSEEIGLLRRAWQSVQEEGRGQVVSISGEAGIGKSVLVDTQRALVRAAGLPQLVMRCSPYHSNSAYHPVIEHFKRLAGWLPGDNAEARITKLETLLQPYDQPIAETLPLLAALLSLAVPTDRYAPLDLSPQQQKQRTQDLCIAMTLETAERQPLLQLWEDLHWADPSTLELIALQIDQAPTASLLMLLTARPEFIPPWPARSHTTPIILNRLESQHTAALIRRIANNKPLPDEVVEHISIKADGVPLYVEELTKTILDSDILRATPESYVLTGPLSSLSIPDTLQESLMARLDRLPQVRELAQLGSVLGREFTYEMISGLSIPGEAVLQDGLEQLVDAELLYQRGRPPRAKYIFKHALVQDAAYGSLLRRTRQQHHRDVAELMETSFPEIIQTNPELIAHHYREAGETSLAIEYLLKAGSAAIRSFASEEAIFHLNSGLEMVTALPAGAERDRSELDLLMLLGPAFVASHGYTSAEVEPTYRRALELCKTTIDEDQEFSALQGLSIFYFVRSDLRQALHLSRQILALAFTRDDSGERLLAMRSLGYVLIMMGDIVEGGSNLTEVTSSYDLAEHGNYVFRFSGADLSVGASGFASFALFGQGYPKQALEVCMQGLSLAQQLGHPMSECLANWVVSIVYGLHNDVQESREHARCGSLIAHQKGIVQYTHFADISLASAESLLNEDHGAISKIRNSIVALQAMSSNLFNPFFLRLLADLQHKFGQPEKALDTVNEAIDETSRTGERFSLADLYRLKGDLVIQIDAANVDEAETCYLQGIDIAKSQNAKGWELRVATSLARLWQDQGELDDARDLLKPVYDWFTEGLDTHDLIEAKKVLDSLV
jgi:class 3 adenylate cyclase/tetratricopeptide (TPR) repeat protein